jgi:hypothetical protein
MISVNYESGDVFRSDIHEIIHLSINSNEVVTLNFNEGCLAVANEINNLYPDFYMFLSGGLDSQLCLRYFLKAGIKPKIIIIKFCGGFTDHDAISALKTCENFNIIPLIIEIPHVMFYNNLFTDIAEKYQIYNFFDSVLAHCAEIVKGPILLVDKLNLRKDVHPDKQWCYIFNEDSMWVQRFNKLNTTSYIINNFFNYHLHQMMSFAQLPRVSNIINGSSNGKISINSSKKSIIEDLNLFNTKHYNPTISDINIAGIKEKALDIMFTKTLFKSRKLYIPVKELLDNKKKLWKFI